MGNQAHPGECEPGEVSGLQGAERVTDSGISSKVISMVMCCATVPDRKEQLEVCRAEARLNRMQIVDQAGEKPEEWFLLECLALLLVHIGKHKDEDG